MANQNNQNNQGNNPEVLTNPIYTPGFLRTQIGKLMRVEFLIGTNNMVDRIGRLTEVGASYILLTSIENDSLVYCDIYSIKFITISTTPMMNQTIPSGAVPNGMFDMINRFGNDVYRKE